MNVADAMRQALSQAPARENDDEDDDDDSGDSDEDPDVHQKTVIPERQRCRTDT
ncbi:MAG: hypothetical protein Q4B26_05370 [Eubacteriales bacterium]|nr:hypothetical protein [Eubacteriales bacterium]